MAHLHAYASSTMLIMRQPTTNDLLWSVITYELHHAGSAAGQG